jgi:predicted ATPase/Tfp pilus assembly protein PilF
VILDNFEQVTRLAHDTLGHWLDRARDAQFLVTTREILGLPGEHARPLSPLSPDEGVDLFVARAAAAGGAFSLDAAERPLVEKLVRLLDGLPLAIELAAARVRVLPVRQIHARMSDRFRLLAASAGRVDRQATLRAAIDWSWDLLSPWEKAGLAQCSAFEGGFGLEAAEAVLDLSAWPDAPWAMDVVHSLVDKSLVRRSTDDRFGLLVSIHEYAAEKLRTPGSYPGSGPEAELAAWVRHGDHLATLGTDAAIAALSSHRGVERLHALVPELDNLAVACRRALLRGDGEAAVALLRAAWEAWELQGPYLAGLELAEGVLALPSLDARQIAHARRVAGRAAFMMGRTAAAEEHLRIALRDFQKIGDAAGETFVRHDIAFLLMADARLDDSKQMVEEGIAVARGTADLWARALRTLGQVLWYQGDLDGAAACSDEALILARQVGDKRTEAQALNSQGAVRCVRGRFAEAAVHWEQAVAVAREVGNRSGECISLGNLGEAELGLGRLEEARAHTEAALALAREIGARRNEGWFLGNLAQLDHRVGRLDEARDVFARGDRILRETNFRYLLSIQLAHRAELELDAGDLEAAGAALAEAEVLVAEMNAGPRSEPGLLVAKVRARLAEQR